MIIRILRLCNILFTTASSPYLNEALLLLLLLQLGHEGGLGGRRRGLVPAKPSKAQAWCGMGFFLHMV